MEAAQQQRQVAQITNIQQIIEGKYVKEDGWTPNYVLDIYGRKLSRVNLMGAVVDAPKDENFQPIVIDDGTARITVREFEDKHLLADQKIGQVVNVIGRVREYNQQKYILPEIVKPLTDMKWLEVRKLQLKKLTLTHKPRDIQPKQTEQPAVIEVEEVIDDKELNIYEQAIAAIKKLDTGNGADHDAVLQQINKQEEVIATLLKNGEIFEVSPGKIKVLD